MAVLLLFPGPFLLVTCCSLAPISSTFLGPTGPLGILCLRGKFKKIRPAQDSSDKLEVAGVVGQHQTGLKHEGISVRLEGGGQHPCLQKIPAMSFHNKHLWCEEVVGCFMNGIGREIKMSFTLPQVQASQTRFLLMVLPLASAHPFTHLFIDPSPMIPELSGVRCPC